MIELLARKQQINGEWMEWRLTLFPFSLARVILSENKEYLMTTKRRPNKDEITPWKEMR